MDDSPDGIAASAIGTSAVPTPVGNPGGTRSSVPSTRCVPKRTQLGGAPAEYPRENVSHPIGCDMTGDGTGVRVRTPIDGRLGRSAQVHVLCQPDYATHAGRLESPTQVAAPSPTVTKLAAMDRWPVRNRRSSRMKYCQLFASTVQRSRPASIRNSDGG
jgi:hypothetical protein